MWVGLLSPAKSNILSRLFPPCINSPWVLQQMTLHSHWDISGRLSHLHFCLFAFLELSFHLNAFSCFVFILFSILVSFLWLCHIHSIQLLSYVILVSFVCPPSDEDRGLCKLPDGRDCKPWETWVLLWWAELCSVQSVQPLRSHSAIYRPRYTHWLPIPSSPQSLYTIHQWVILSHPVIPFSSCL